MGLFYMIHTKYKLTKQLSAVSLRPPFLLFKKAIVGWGKIDSILWQDGFS